MSPSFLICFSFQNRIQKSNKELNEYVAAHATEFIKLREKHHDEITVKKCLVSNNPVVKGFVNFAIPDGKLKKIQACMEQHRKNNKADVKKTVKRLQQAIQTALDKDKRRK